MQLVVRVLHLDDRAVDENADGDGDARERHEVRVHPHRLEGNESERDADGNGDDGHDGRWHVPEEDQDDDGDDDHLLDQFVLHVTDRAADELGAIVGRYHLDPGGQRRFQLGESRLDPLDDVEGILAVAHHDYPPDDVPLAVEVGDSSTKLGAERDAGDVPHRHRRTAHRLEHDGLEVLRALHVAAAAHHELPARELDQPAAHVVVPAPDRLDEIAHRQPVGDQVIGVHADLVLAHLPADGGDLRDAGDGLQRVAQEPILVRAQLVARVAAGAIDERVLEHPADAGRVRPQLGLHAGRQRALDLAQVLEDAAARPVQIGAVLEDDVDVAVAEVREAADRLHPRRSQHVGGDRIGDLVLDDVGAAVPARVDDDLRVAQVRQGIERDVLRAPEGSAEGHEDPREDEAAMLRGEADDLLDHGLLRACGFDADLEPRAASAAFRRDSESTRKLARTTTRSPGCTPERTSTVSLSASPASTSRGSKRPSARETKTTLRSPESRIESAGTRRPSCGRVWKTTSPNISGRNSPRGFVKARRTLAVRVFASITGSMKLTFPVKTRLRTASMVKETGVPTRTRGRSLSCASARTQTCERSVIWKGVSPATTREPCTTVFAVTTPEMGDTSVISRSGAPP